MRSKLITLLAVLVAAVGWWGLYELTGKVHPDQPGAQTFFFALLFLALTATFAPPAAYLNRRFAPEATERDAWRFLRHSAWGGLCLTSWAWLQALRALSPAFALVIAMIFVAMEVVIVRLRNES
jgi:drug/metabolite transporter (DMT)-like permease